ncbi:MAG: serine hydrolase [Planctomycetota bacterium]
MMRGVSRLILLALTVSTLLAAAPAGRGGDWEVSTPEEQGLDSAHLVHFLREARELDLHEVIVVRNGRLVLDVPFYPFRSGVVHALHSVTKSVVSVLIGIAIDEGAIAGVGAPLVEFFPDREVIRRETGDGSKGEPGEVITLEHVLAMTSGFEWAETSLPYADSRNMATRMMRSGDWVAFALQRPRRHDPGTVFNYNSGGSHLLVAVLRNATREEPLAFARKHLFEPLGISAVHWMGDPSGLPSGGNGLFMLPRDLAKIGWLYLQAGEWEGRQIVSADWTQASTRPRVATDNLLFPAFGYHWWVGEDGSFAGMGLGGQFLFVVPHRRMVVVVTAGVPPAAVGEIPALVRRSILPAALGEDPLPANREAMEALRAEVEAAALSPDPEPLKVLPGRAKEIGGKRYLLEENPWGWKSLAIEFAEAEARVTLEIGTGFLVQPVGLDGVYRITEGGPHTILGSPLAARGEWEDEHTFVWCQQGLHRAESWEHRYSFARGTVAIEVHERLEGATLLETRGRSER